RGVVNQHDIRGWTDPIERVRHRVLSSPPTRYDANGRRGVSRDPIGRRSGQAGGKHDDDVVDAIVADESCHTTLENRSAVDLEQLLRHGRAEPTALAGRRDDGGYMHGMEQRAAIKRTLYRTELWHRGRRKRFIHALSNHGAHLFRKI